MNTQSRPIQIRYEGRLIRYICPKCHQPVTFRRRYLGRSLCLKCGQKLDWEPTSDICTETVTAMDSDEAAWIASTYYKIIGTPEGEQLDTDDWRMSIHNKTELYLYFKTPKQRGSFMRKYSKEGFPNDG